jgi:hypothetical protein
MKYLLLIAAIMTLTSATTISSSDTGCCDGGSLLPRRLLHDNDPIIRHFDKGPRWELAGPLCLVDSVTDRMPVRSVLSLHRQKLSPVRVHV